MRVEEPKECQNRECRPEESCIGYFLEGLTECAHLVYLGWRWKVNQNFPVFAKARVKKFFSCFLSRYHKVSLLSACRFLPKGPESRWTLAFRQLPLSLGPPSIISTSEYVRFALRVQSFYGESILRSICSFGSKFLSVWIQGLSSYGSSLEKSTKKCFQFIQHHPSPMVALHCFVL